MSKRKLPLILGALFAAFTISAVKVDAAEITVDTYPFDPTIGAVGRVLNVNDLKNRIDRGIGKYTYTDDNGHKESGTITSDMCYVYANSPKKGSVWETGKGIKPFDIAQKATYNTDAYGITNNASAIPVTGVMSWPEIPVNFYSTGKPNPAVPAGSVRVSDWNLQVGSYTLVVRKMQGTKVLAYHEYRFNSSVIASIRWPEQLTKTKYYQGEKLDLSKDFITIGFENGATSKEPIGALYPLAASKEAGTWPVQAYKLGQDFTTNTAGTFDLAVAYNSAKAEMVLGTNTGDYSKPLRFTVPLVYNSTFNKGTYFDVGGDLMKNVDDRYFGLYCLDANDDHDHYHLSKQFQDPMAPPYHSRNSASLGWSQDDDGDGIGDPAVAKKFCWADFPVTSNGPITYKITVEASNAPIIKYNAHVQNIGWQGYFYAGEQAGTTGKSLRMEALRIDIVNSSSSTTLGSVTYRSHVQYQGWQDWVKANEVTGTTGLSRRMEAIEIKLTGRFADLFKISYRTHIQGIGWQDWKSDGEQAGTTGLGKRLEAIEIKVTAK